MSTIEVNKGEALTQEHLKARIYKRQKFTLDPDCVLNINEGGRIGGAAFECIGNTGLLMGRKEIFDFRGSTVNINSGGFFYQRSVVANATVNVFDGGRLGYLFCAERGTTLNIYGGIIGTCLNIYAGSTVSISGASVMEKPKHSRDHAFFLRTHYDVTMCNSDISKVFGTFNAAIILRNL